MWRYRSLIFRLALRNLRSDWFGTLAAVLGVALGTATVNVVLTIDMNTRTQEAGLWSTDPSMEMISKTVQLVGLDKNNTPTKQEDAKEETHEDYQVMRSAIRLGSLSAFLVGALIVFFTFRVVVEQRRREIALLRSLGATSRQVAAVFLLESLLVGAAGGALGFLTSPILSVMAAIAGVTTTGRSQLYWLWFPWKIMLGISAVGAMTAVLGVLSPLRDVLRLDVSRTLRPQFIDSEDTKKRRRPRGLTLIALPFMVLMYVLIRPFFVEVLPSLAFFVLEAGLVCAGFLSLLVLVPQVVELLGSAISRVLPGGPKAARLLTIRRIQRAGHEFSWAVSGVMMVFSLLLGLHIVTRSLKMEVVDWAQDLIRNNAYIITRDYGPRLIPPAALKAVPPEVFRVHYSGRTPWPNALMAVKSDELRAYAQDIGEDTFKAVEQLGPGKAILSELMARRYQVAVGDKLRVQGKRRSADLEIVGITDVGYMPMIGPYRDSKTFGLVDAADFDLLEGFADPVGAGIALRIPKATYEDNPDYWAILEPAYHLRGLHVEQGRLFEEYRVRETDQDFAIFDVILLLTGILAGLGIANNLVLSAHIRRREIALYRVLGMKSAQVRTLFLMEGTFIGILGGVMAVVLGIPIGFLSIGALEVISAFEVHFDVPVYFPIVTILGAVAISLTSSLYPALRASRLSSAESVHYE